MNTACLAYQYLICCIISETFKLVFDYSQFIGNKFDRSANMWPETDDECE